jgi:hypothetical protein
MHSTKLTIYGGAAGLTILIWVVAYHMAQGVGQATPDSVVSAQPTGGNPGPTQLSILTPPQERLLQVLVSLQRRYASSKLVIGRHGQSIHFDDDPNRGSRVSVVQELFGATEVDRGSEFERLMESMPPDFVRVFPESRWDSPFVVGVTDRGMEYLRDRGLSAPARPIDVANPPAESADLEATVRAEAARNPKAALALVSLELERQLRPFMAATGFHNRARPGATLPEDLDLISETWPLSQSFRGSARRFWDTRETVIRGYDVANDDVLRAVDSGLLIFKTLQSLQREKKVVASVGVELFVDREGRTPRRGVWGLMLENTSADGKETKSFQVFPTTRTDYRLGEEVTWDWEMSKVYGETWYRDPRSGEIRHAWEQSAEFAGRSLNDVNKPPR